MPRTKRSSIETEKALTAHSDGLSLADEVVSPVSIETSVEVAKPKRKSKSVAKEDGKTEAKPKSRPNTEAKAKSNKAAGAQQNPQIMAQESPESTLVAPELFATRSNQSSEHYASVLQNWREQIQEAVANKNKIRIVGGESKTWFAPYVDAADGQQEHADRSISLLRTTDYAGVIEYEPSELYIQARSGTSLREIKRLLAQHGQILAFEPPLFGDSATVGGMLACGLSGPRRAYAAAMKDHVLGVSLINGRAEMLRFGTKVIKNVAGYDVSRLMVGSLGSLGVITDITLKVIPAPQSECSLVFAVSEQDAMRLLQRWAGQCLPISASCYYAGRLTLRLSGLASVVDDAHQKLGGIRLDQDHAFWESLGEQQHHFFHAEPELNLWRLSLPSTAPAPDFRCKSLLEWGGALRWMWTLESPETVQSYAQENRGHATLFRVANGLAPSRSPLNVVQAKIQERIRAVFDPEGIFDLGQWRS